MIVDWASFAFGAATAIALGAVLTAAAIAAVYIRAAKYRSHPLFTKDNP